jgi:hypothetical protein
MTRAERLHLIEQLNATQAAVDAALDILVGVSEAKRKPAPAKSSPKKTRAK